MEESACAEIQEEANAWIISVNENSESQREANSPSGNEIENGEVDREANLLDDRRLTDEINKMLGGLGPPLSKECCIYRVPRDLRKLNDEAYSPHHISIGPFHHGDKRLNIMENIKMRYFKRLVTKTGLNVEHLVNTIRRKEGNVRRCYAETSKLSSDAYVKMITLDASFIIVFFLISDPSQEWRCDDDSIVFTPRLETNMIKDMWLLENQLPFFIIEEVFNHAFASRSNFISFSHLAFGFFQRYNTQNMSPNTDLKIKHFVDLLRTFFLPQSDELPQRNNEEKVTHLYTVSELEEAGVKFKVSSSKCLFELKFKNGELEIPCLNFYNETESRFRNLVALEQCHHEYHGYVTDYIRVLDFLIDTAKDVDLLVRKGILVNVLGDSNAVKTLVNNLCTRTVYYNMNSSYYKLCQDLNRFYEDPRHSWKATLRRDYFSTPWRIASTVAAIILLVLTFAQTLCSIFSLPQI